MVNLKNKKLPVMRSSKSPNPPKNTPGDEQSIQETSDITTPTIGSLPHRDGRPVPPINPGQVLQLQRLIGNRAVTRFLSEKSSAQAATGQAGAAPTQVIQRAVGEIKKPTVRKSNTVSWYQRATDGSFTKSNTTVKKGVEIKEARQVSDNGNFAWVKTVDDKTGYLHTSNLNITSWGAPVDKLDKNSLLEPVVGGQQLVPAMKDTSREWYLDQAVLMEAYRSLKAKEAERRNANDPQAQRELAITQKQLALAMLQSFAKSAAIDQTSIGDALGIQSTPYQTQAIYHRSTAGNNLLDKLRSLVAQDMKVGFGSLQVLNDPLFAEVLAREFPVYRSGKEPQDKVDTNIDSLVKFGTSLDALLKNFAAGHAPENTFVFNVTPFYLSLNCSPTELNEKLTRPLEQILLKKSAEVVKDKDPKVLVNSVLNHIQLVVVTKHKGIDVLLVPKLFKPLSVEEKKAFSQDEQVLHAKVDTDEREVFMEAGSHDDRKLDSAMIESGARMDPISAKNAMLEFVSPEKILEESNLTPAKLTTSDKKTPTVCKSINDFLKTSSFIKFRELSHEKDAAPYQQVYPEATAALLAGLAQVNQQEGGIDKVFETKHITDLLQHAYYRMLNAMAGAATYKADLIQFMNNIELIHNQLQMILAVAEPHSPNIAFSEGITKAMKEAPKGKKPTLPQGLGDPLVHHKASAMHSVASILSSVEDQKEQGKAKTRKLNAVVLKDNYYEAHGAVDNAKTYDVSILDGYKLSKEKDVDTAFEHGKKPTGPIDVFICDFHHNISVERSEYKVEDLGYQVDQLFQKGLVADQLTVAIDCTVDFIRSDDVRKFLEKNKSRITTGKLNVVLYRSAQKFDMLGMDNYYGGFTVTINDGISFKAFNDRIDKKEDQSSGLSHQGMSHLAQFGSDHLDSYRKAIMKNTRKLYKGLPAQCKGDLNSPLMVAITEDPRNVFLDIQFPGRSELFAVGNTNMTKGPIMEGFYLHFIKWAQSQNLAFTTRPSFGFATTNFTIIAGSKVRLNPGLESEEALNKYIAYFTKVQQLLADSEKEAFKAKPKSSFSDQKKLTEFLDKISDEALTTWTVPKVESKNLTSAKSISAPKGVPTGNVKIIKGSK